MFIIFTTVLSKKMHVDITHAYHLYYLYYPKNSCPYNIHRYSIGTATYFGAIAPSSGNRSHFHLKKTQNPHGT
jgi:hypothetical protein